MSALEHVGPDGEERLGNCSGVREVRSSRNRQALRRRHAAEFRIAASGDERAHAVARFPVADVVADLFNLTRDLEARNVGRPRRRRVLTHPLHHVRPIHPCSRDLDEHFPTRRNRGQ